MARGERLLRENERSMSDDIQSWLDYRDQFAVTTFTNPHERIEQLILAVERLEESLKEAYQISHYGRGSMRDIDDVLERAIRTSQAAKPVEQGK